MSIFLQDVRFALRQLWKHPGFTITAVLSLSLGIAATVSVFSVVYSVLLHPTIYKDADRLVQIYVQGKTGAEYTPYISNDAIASMRSAHAFENVVEMNEEYLSETTGELPQDVDVVYLSGNAFPFFGVPAFLGRTFLPSDAPRGQSPQPVVVLTYQYWQRRFNGNRAIIGQPLRLDGRSYTILGVMPRRFAWWDADVYVPLNTSDATSYMMVMRLQKGVSIQATTAEIRPIFERMAHDHPGLWLEDTTFDVRGIDERIFRPMRGVLYLLFAAVALLLGIGCGNVSILLLARGTARQHEFAVRAAVGASRWRIIRQLLTESVILGFTGAVLGVIATYRSTPWVVSLLPWKLFPRGLEIPVHIPVLVFSVLLALATSVFFGLLPALLLTKPEIREVMQQNTQKTAGSVSGKRLYSVLIAGQMALAMLLLAAAAAAIQSFNTLLHSDLGYEPRKIADFGIPVHKDSYNNWEARANYFTQIRQRVAEAPGVTATTLALVTPPYSAWDFPLEILGQDAAPGRLSNVDPVGPEYFSMLRIPLVQGRLWQEAEAEHGAQLAVVNRTFVKRYFPSGDVLGHSVRFPRLRNTLPFVASPGSSEWLEIIGVVGDVRNDGLDRVVKPEVYIPYSLFMADSVQLLVASSANPLALEQSVRRQIASVNPGQQVSYPVSSLATALERQPTWAREKLVAVLSGVFSALALALSSIGLYSVVSYSVGQRIHEFGIRMALGAQRRHILQNVLGEAGISVGAGLVVGLILSFAANGLITRYAQQAARSPLLTLSVSLLLVAVALLACILPAIRASMVQPMKALRTE